MHHGGTLVASAVNIIAHCPSLHSSAGSSATHSVGFLSTSMRTRVVAETSDTPIQLRRKVDHVMVPYLLKKNQVYPSAIDRCAEAPMPQCRRQRVEMTMLAAREKKAIRNGLRIIEATLAAVGNTK